MRSLIKLKRCFPSGNLNFVWLKHQKALPWAKHILSMIQLSIKRQPPQDKRKKPPQRTLIPPHSSISTFKTITCSRKTPCTCPRMPTFTTVNCNSWTKVWMYNKDRHNMYALNLIVALVKHKKTWLLISNKKLAFADRIILQLILTISRMRRMLISILNLT
jgi:hypothetical protein